MSIKRGFFILFALFVTTSCAFAQTNSNKASQLVTKLTKGQAKVVQSFPSIGNLEGFVIEPNDPSEGQPTIIYADKNGQYAFVGALLTPDGNNQSAADNEQYIASNMAKKALGAAQKTAWILDGKANAPHITYAVADPNCIYCNQLYVLTRPYVQSGQLAIRWVWAGFLKSDSAGIAQAILAAKDPLAAMATNENKFDKSNEQGGLSPLKNPSHKVMEQFNKNMAFWNAYHFPGTPVLLYLDKKGQPQATFGLPTGDQLKETIDGMSNKL